MRHARQRNHAVAPHKTTPTKHGCRNDNQNTPHDAKPALQQQPPAPPANPLRVPPTLGNVDESLCASRSTPSTSAQSRTFPMGSALRNRRRTRDPSVSRSMSVEAVPSFTADSGGSWPSSPAFLSRLREVLGSGCVGRAAGGKKRGRSSGVSEGSYWGGGTVWRKDVL